MIDDLLETIFVFLILVIFVGLLISPFIISSTLSIYCENNAMVECKDLGHETYVSYTRAPFGTTPLSLVCGTMVERQVHEGIIKSYTVDGDNVINMNNMNNMN